LKQQGRRHIEEGLAIRSNIIDHPKTIWKICLPMEKLLMKVSD